MAHNVKCKICGQTFDRDIYEAVKVSAARYAHKTCAELHPEIKTMEAITPKESLKQNNEKLILNKEQEQITVNMKTGAVTAKSAQLKEEQKEKEDFERLKDTIRDIFGDSVVWSRVIKQINSYRKKYGYSYSGMMRSLIYYYQKMGNDPRKSNGSIGIIPHIYDAAYNYYYQLWLLQQRNIDNNLQYKTLPTQEIKNVNIKLPESKPIKIEMRKPLFDFLEEDNVGEN